VRRLLLLALVLFSVLAGACGQGPSDHLPAAPVASPAAAVAATRAMGSARLVVEHRLPDDVLVTTGTVGFDPHRRRLVALTSDGERQETREIGEDRYSRLSDGTWIRARGPNPMYPDVLALLEVVNPTWDRDRYRFVADGLVGEAWLDAEGRVRRVRLVVGPIAITTDLHRFGAPVRIRPPD
jgi:hypothetical protein